MAEQSEGQEGNEVLMDLSTEDNAEELPETTTDDALECGMPERNNVNLKIELVDYLKAGYPFLYIRTEEDLRAVQLVKKAIKQIPPMHDIQYVEWRSTTGLLECNLETHALDSKSNAVAQDIIASLKWMRAQTQAVVAVFHNIRQFTQIAQVVQQLKDTVYDAKNKGSHVIIIGASVEIPPELTNILTVYDLDLPNQEKFKDDFKAIIRPYRDGLVEQATDPVITIAANSAVGMTQLQGENAIALSIAKSKKIDPRLIQVEKEQAIKRNDVLEFIHNTEDLSALGGFSELKGWLDKRKGSLGLEARRYGLKFPKGILLVGVPGTGKSLASRCIASYFNIPLLKLDMGRVFKSLVGSSEGAVRASLKTAEAVSPVVLWIEEIEKSMAGSQSSGSTDSGTTARVMSTVLTWMQENTKPIFICATANNVDALPPELLRKGRFTEIWGVVEPDSIERREVWDIQINKQIVQCADAYDVDALVDASEGMTGAEIEGIVEEAMFDAFADGERAVTTEDMIEATKAIVPQSVMCAERIDAIRTWMKTKARFVGNSVETKQKGLDKQWRNIHMDNTEGTKIQ